MRLAWFAAALLAACVPSRSAMFDPVEHDVHQRAGVAVAWNEDDSRTAAAIDALLARPLDADTAVRIALARNRRLQASFDQLGIAASAIAEATVLPPLEVDVNHKFPLSGSGSETEIVAVQDVLDLLQIGQRRAAASADVEASRARAVAATVRLIAEVEQAFTDVVAAEQDRELVQTAFQAAEASADLVERQHAAGNTTDLALEREQEQRERMRVDVMRAEQVVSESRAALGALIGIDAAHRDFKVTPRLADVPQEMPKLDDLAQSADAASLDKTALRAEADAAAARHRYAVVRSFLPALGVGVAAAKRETNDWELGPTVRIGLPLFNQQQGPRARARAEEKRARDELAAVSAELRGEALAAQARAMRSYEESRQLHDVVMPMRDRILKETVLQYNAMNASTFELLTARREMVDVGRQYIDALRRYWRAIAEVEALRRGAARMSMEGSR